jgi:hypothetical protein
MKMPNPKEVVARMISSIRNECEEGGGEDSMQYIKDDIETLESALRDAGFLAEPASG